MQDNVLASESCARWDPLEQGKLAISVMSHYHHLVEHWAHAQRAILDLEHAEFTESAQVVDKRVTNESILVRRNMLKKAFKGGQYLNLHIRHCLRVI